MNRDDFLNFVSRVKWCFCKSVPNWPHFYIVEKNLPDQAAFREARAFVRQSGYAGKFFDMEVSYFDADGWTYWTSPLAKPHESQYMLNKCKTEYTYESLAKSGSLPPEGFRESKLSLSPILEDLEFRSLVREAAGREFTVFDVLGTSDYEIRHSNVVAWLLDRNGNHRQGSSFLDLLWQCIAREHNLPNLSFLEYSVTREGKGEDEKIDILIKAENREWVIVIENKLFSPETGNQLERYFRDIERRYPKASHRFYFYLTPDGIAPAKEEDNKNWKPISYATVVQAVKKLLEKTLSDRVKNFLEQYLEHIERNVLRSARTIEKQRTILRRHVKVFHSLTYLLEEEYIQRQCSEFEFSLLKSILAVQQDVGRELFGFTKQMMAKHGYSRYSGLGHWITLELPGLQEKLGMAKPNDTLPIIFALDARPNSYVAEVWLYKNKPLFSKLKGRLPWFGVESPEPNRGDEHLVAVLYRRTIIDPDQIIKETLPDLKNRIAAYFDSDLKQTLEDLATQISNALDAIARRDMH